MSHLECPSCHAQLTVSTRPEHEQVSPHSALPMDSEHRHINHFLRDCADTDRVGREDTNDVMSRYLAWCDEKGFTPMSRQMFGRRIVDLGVERKRSQGRRYYCGVQLR